MHYVKMSLTPEGSIQPNLKVSYDFDDNNKPQPASYSLDSIPLPTIFGSATFGTGVFGASTDPMVRQAVQGSGHNVALKLFSEDTKAPYSINGFYIDYRPSGRR